MAKDTLRSSMESNVVTASPLKGTYLDTYDLGKQTPRLDSNMTSVGFESMGEGMDEDIPGPGLMTCLDPEQTGSGALDSSFGTTPISGPK